jgi:NAD(P)-dependent dehydrogenase (short-subunit alcohol dehydrogenase family)
MIIISGASRGIGKYLLETFKEQSIEVIGLYNNTKPENYSESYIKVDVRNFEDIEKELTPLISDAKELILINCAGITYSAFAHKSDPERWKEVIETNLIGTYNLIRSVLPKMREINHGRIINFSSVVAVKGTPGVSAYAATKSAFWGLSKSIAIENANKNITINSINLGYSELGMIKEVPEQYMEQIKSEIPMKRLCSPDEILSTVNYLINTGYITGESLNVNGGLT